MEAVLRRVEGEGEQTSIFQDEAGGSGVRATEAERIPEAERTDITKAGQPEKQVVETEVQDKINNALNEILNKIKTKKDIIEYRILQNRHNGNIVVQSKTTKGDILNATILSGDGNVTTGNYSGDNPITLQDWTKTSEIVSDKAETVDISYHAGDLATGAAKLPIKVSPDDIPIDIAESAYRNVSFDPRGRAHADQRLCKPYAVFI